MLEVTKLSGVRSQQYWRAENRGAGSFLQGVVVSMPQADRWSAQLTSELEARKPAQGRALFGGRIVNNNLTSRELSSYTILFSHKTRQKDCKAIKVQNQRCVFSAYNASCLMLPFVVLIVRAEYRRLRYDQQTQPHIELDNRELLNRYLGFSCLLFLDRDHERMILGHAGQGLYAQSRK
jgi:hypothetical protein